MEHTHNTCEHLGGNVLIDLVVVIKAEGTARAKDGIDQVNNLVLVLFALEEALTCAIIEAFLVALSFG